MTAAEPGTAAGQPAGPGHGAAGHGRPAPRALVPDPALRDLALVPGEPGSPWDASAPDRRRVLAHQCAACRRHWALRVVEHPAGTVVRCRFCGALVRPDHADAPRPSGAPLRRSADGAAPGAHPDSSGAPKRTATGA